MHGGQRTMHHDEFSAPDVKHEFCCNIIIVILLDC